MNLEKKLVCLRKEKGLSQAEVAEALNVSRQAVSRWEAGAAVPSTENLHCLSKLYETSLDSLLNGETAQAPTPASAAEDNEEKTRCRKSRARHLLAISAVLLLLLGIFITVWMERKGEDQVDLSELQGEGVESVQKAEFTVEW